MTQAEQILKRAGAGMAGIFLCAVVLFSLPAQATAQSKNEAVLNLMKVSGMQEGSPRVQMDAYFLHLTALGLNAGEIQSLQNIIGRFFQPHALVKNLQSQLQEKFNRNHADRLQSWYESELGQRAREAEEAFTGDLLKQKVQAFEQSLKKNPPEINRIQIIFRIVRAGKLVDYSINTAETLMMLTFPYMSEARSRALLMEGREYVQEHILKTLLYTYRNFSNEELRALADAEESKAHRWFQRMVRLSHYDALNRAADEGMTLLSKILNEIDSGQGGYTLVKEIFPPGERYRLLIQRDPFLPLVLPQGFNQTISTRTAPGKRGESLVETKPPVVDFAKRFPLIPFELYKQIQDSDPGLFEQLESFGQFFSNERALQQLDEEMLNEKISSYSQLIRRANQMKNEMPLTPLQAGYDQFRLVGMIQKGTQKLALVQKDDQSGHSIKKGALMGPNFGIVEQISPDKIVILEKTRNYAGKILSQKKEIKFTRKKTDESEAPS
ncbi:MAG: pilus assembly protein PilP [Candidatus Nitrohelix vancouverensis]|uniref:Pilus assembly protein PilP n=1 Tax=Candidatus Nitrohelix vancouverensis TaxID=2705534 RepID=A0A7T0G2V6_9BACT|nr:MAG: pilus assembly protein PilP [Candidatus Nitrohelix vancouverensis]